MTCRFLTWALALSVAGCDSEAGGISTDGDADADADADAGADASADGCRTAPYLGVDGCDLVGLSYPCDGHDHVPEGSAITWPSNPPHSGDHYADPESEWGEHEEVVPRGTWVANLELGGIVLLHSCPELCDRELDVLRDVIAQRPDARILMTPDPGIAGGRRFVAVSWTWILATDDPDLDELLCFVDEHEGHGPEDPH